MVSLFEVLYEDNHQLVANKSAGVLTQPSGTDQENLEALAKQWIKEKAQKPGNVFLEAVHRLDKPVSGIVLFAKTSKALSRLNEFIRNKQLNKVYLALVEGVPSKKEGTLEHYLIHGEHRSFIASEKDSDAKLAKLHYRIVESKDNQALLEITLETGRYHQIRAQLSAIGCPIIGDHKYGSVQELMDGTIRLHHYRLQVPHPITQAMQTFAVSPNWI